MVVLALTALQAVFFRGQESETARVISRSYCYGILKKNGARHFSLIGRHLESVGRTEPVFELNLALSEKRLANEFRSDSCGLKLQTLCQGKGARSQRNK